MHAEPARRPNHPPKPLRRGLLSHSGGAAALEFAFALPVLLTGMLAIVEFGRLLWAQNALHYAVEEAARCYTIDSTVCSSSSTTQSFAASRSGLTFPSSDFTVTTATCGNQVSASYQFTFLTKLVNVPVTLTAQSCFPA